MKTLQKGFTLIELMIVIAILGILIAIALPAYQDYTIRTKNAECLSEAASAKLAVAETFQASPTAMPVDAAAAGYDFTGTKYCGNITVTNGVIDATTRDTGGDVTFRLTPDPGEGKIDWDCALAEGEPQHAPAECRS